MISSEISVMCFLALISLSHSSKETEIHNGTHTSDDLCPPWFFYNTIQNECQCFHNDNSLRWSNVRCTEGGALLAFGWCMTYDEESRGTFIGLCPSFVVGNRNVSDHLFITLPSNVSQLNEYMCGPLNRQGLVCSECIDGFAPSVTSVGYQCANCSDVWYGVPLYLLLLFVPITMLYLFIVYFQISLTCAPMTGFILYCQLVALTYKQHDPLRLTLTHEYVFMQYYFGILASLCGVWNLDFFYYVMPPFCVSLHLKNIHVLFFDYFACFYSFCLIGITWMCISLHSCGCQPFVWLWLKLKPCFMRKQRDSHRTIIDVFSTFLLLSYTKLLLTSIVILQPSTIRNINRLPRKLISAVDPSIQYFSGEHIAFSVIAIVIFVVAVLLPALILALYPARRFRSLLFIIGFGGHSKAGLNIFVEKFYCCYRDGLDGSKDMRSFAALYFFIRIIGFFGIALFPTMSLAWLFQVLLFGGCSLLIALVHPYKKAYMNITDSLLLCAIAIFAILYLMHLYAFSDSPAIIYQLSIIVVLTLPLMCFAAYVIITVFVERNFCNWIRNSKRRGEQHEAHVSDMASNSLDSELPDRVVNPGNYRQVATQNDTMESSNPSTSSQHALPAYVAET